MKKILLITSDYFPLKSPRSHRATELSIELAAQGNIVNVLTHRIPDIHNEYEILNNIVIVDFKYYKWQLWFKETILGIYTYKLLCRLYLFQYFFLVRQSLNGLKNYDVVISISSPFSIAWGLSSISKKRIKSDFKTWIADLGDPFILNKGLKRKPLFIFHFFEWNMLRKANFVVIPFEEMKLQFYSFFHHKFEIIPQGVKIKHTTVEYIQNNPIRIGFSGYMYPGIRDVFSLLDFLILNDYDFEFIVYTNQNSLFDRYNKLLGNKLTLNEYVSRDQLINELASLDFLVAVNFDSVDGNLTALPSKLIDYAMAKRPILLYEHSKLPISVIDEFMAHNFENQYFVDISKYDINVVALSFMNLLKKGIIEL